MNLVQERFLQALRAALKNEQVPWGTDAEIDWSALFSFAQKHHVLPMIYEAVSGCPAFQIADPDVRTSGKQQAMQSILLQTFKTKEFLTVYKKLTEQGFHPLVVKGLVCRELYPRPQQRPSVDEDLLMPDPGFIECCEALTALGMQRTGTDAEPTGETERDKGSGCGRTSGDHEISFELQGTPLHIELHRDLFSSGSAAYGEWNRFFEDAWERRIMTRIGGVEIFTMEHTDHLFYLICHAFKHFLHSGFGIRQVCDIILYANTYGEQIDWNRIVQNCREIRAEKFAVALFKIGERYLTFDPVRAAFSEEWRQLSADETALLEDLLASGIHGAESMTRRHSSTITINAVAADRTGKRSPGILRSVFPPAKKMRKRYPYLDEKKYLLPIAWADRILKYRRETARAGAENSAAESVKLGNARVELLRQYDIID